MPEKTVLPSGGWVLFREEQDVTERQRRPYARVMLRMAGMVGSGVQGLTEAQAEERFLNMAKENPDLADLMSDRDVAHAAMLIQEWSYPEDITPDSILDLPGRDYAAIKEALKDTGDGSPDFDPTPDPETPTEPFSA